ncbi:MAG: copper chaperone PCu(A)C, partial [Gammaproteobacteria bacterium]
ALCLGLWLAAPAAAEVVVTDAWVRAAPVPHLPLAAYLSLENRGEEAVEFVALSSPAFARVEWHETAMDGGMARMRHVPAPRLGASTRLAMAPGGQHLMLFDPVSPLAPGDRVRLELRLSDGQVLSAEAPVRRGSDADDRPHRQHHHHDHQGPPR